MFEMLSLCEFLSLLGDDYDVRVAVKTFDWLEPADGCTTTRSRFLLCCTTDTYSIYSYWSGLVTSAFVNQQKPSVVRCGVLQQLWTFDTGNIWNYPLKNVLKKCFS